MNKNILVAVIVILIIGITGIIIILNNNNEDILYSTTYYFALGSRRVKIYTNGDIYDDVEIEEPNHKPNYKYLKTLTETEKNNLINFLKSESNTDIIDNYVIELVYGVKEFDDSGRYFTIFRKER